MGANVEHRIVPRVGDRETFAVGRKFEPLGEACFGPALSTSLYIAFGQADRLDDQGVSLITTRRVAVHARREPRQVWMRAAIHVEAPAAGALANHQDFVL